MTVLMKCTVFRFLHTTLWLRIELM